MTDLTSPRIVVCPSPADASQHVARIIAAAIRSNPRIVLGLATGGTPVEVYRELQRMHREEGLDFSTVTSFNLDEYVGLGPEHPQSFRYFMQQRLFDHVNFEPSHTYVPDGLAADIDAHTRDYESRIQTAGGIDLQLLGIGSNGHIAFNEPGSSTDSRTRMVELTQNTINANSRFFDSVDQVPHHAITMGIGTIMEAKQIVMMATGDGKADAVRRAIEGDVSPSHPASLLQRHSDVTFVVDEAASALLSRH